MFSLFYIPLASDVGMALSIETLAFSVKTSIKFDESLVLSDSVITESA